VPGADARRGGGGLWGLKPLPSQEKCKEKKFICNTFFKIFIKVYMKNPSQGLLLGPILVRANMFLTAERTIAQDAIAQKSKMNYHPKQFLGVYSFTLGVCLLGDDSL